MIYVLCDSMKSSPSRMTDFRNVLTDTLIEQAEQLATDILSPSTVAFNRIGIERAEVLLKLILSGVVASQEVDLGLEILVEFRRQTQNLLGFLNLGFQVTGSKWIGKARFIKSVLSIP